MRATSSPTASSSPDSTTDAGPLTAAIETRPAAVPRCGDTSSSGARTATIAPPAGSAAISRPRAATNRTASARENTPATQAAANSPTEWPTKWRGRTPCSARSACEATSNAKSAGWA